MRKNFLFNVVVVSTLIIMGLFSSCKDYQDDITGLRNDIEKINKSLDTKSQVADLEAAKAALQKEIASLKTTLDAAVVAADKKVADLEAAYKAADAANKKELEDKIAAAKDELLKKLLTKDAFDKYVESTDAKLVALGNDIKAIKETIAKLGDTYATDDEVAVAVANLEAKLRKELVSVKDFTEYVAGTNEKINGILERLKGIDEKLAAFDALTETFASKKDLKTLEGRVDAIDVKLANIYSVLDIVDGKSKVLDGIKSDITKNVEDIKANKEAIEKTAADLVSAKADLEKQIGALRTELEAKIKEAIDKINATNDNVSGIDTRLKHIEDLIKGGATGTDNALDLINKDIDALKEADEKLGERITAEVTTIKASITSLESKIAALEARMDNAEADITELKTAVATLNKFKSDFDELVGAKIDAAKAEITKAYTEAIEKAVEELKAIDADIMAAVKLNNLVLIPDLVGRASRHPLVDFSPLHFGANAGDCKGFIQENQNTVLRYRVSPSNVTEDMIGKLRFEHVKSTLRAAEEPFATAEFVSLADGILSVKVRLDSKTINKEYNKIDQLQLVVTPKEGEKDGKPVYGADVYSDWVEVVKHDLFTDYLNISKYNEGVIEKVEKHHWRWSNFYFSNSLADTKNLPYYDQRVIVIPFDKDTDLKEQIALIHLDDKKINLEDYELVYTFDENDEDGKQIVYKDLNNVTDIDTDQQKFITVTKDGIVTPTSYKGDVKYNRSAIDKTPIVRVQLFSKNKDYKCAAKPILTYFIKLRIADINDPKVSIDFKADSFDINDICKDSLYLMINTDQMNEEFYTKLNMSKEEFHRAYSIENDNISNCVNKDNFASCIGYAEVREDSPGSGSWNVYWSIRSSYLTSNIGKTIQLNAYFKHNVTGERLNITFTANVLKPAVNVSSWVVSNFWNPDATGEITRTYTSFHTTIPAVGDTNPNNFIYEKDIDAVFQNLDNGTVKMSMLKDRNLAKKLDYLDNSKYEFKFVKSDQVLYRSESGRRTVEIEVANDGKSINLVNKYDNAITRIDDNVLTIDANNVVKFNENSVLGKEMLNHEADFLKARVQMTMKTSCDVDVALSGFKFNKGTAFDIHFLRPVNVAQKSEEGFIHTAGFGEPGTSIEIADMVNLMDWRGKKFSAFNNYRAFHGVENITVDVKKITGEGIESLKGIELAWDNTDADPAKGKYGKLTYKNNSVKLEREFKLKVPVTVTYKFGSIVTYVYVPVKIK